MVIYASCIMYARGRERKAREEGAKQKKEGAR